MGTRCLTHVRQEDEGIPIETLVTMYRQFDGYPSGHGKELADFLRDREVGNGITSYDAKFSNGPNDLAAQLILEFKQRDPVGGIYIQRRDTTDVGEEYVYTIVVRDYRDVTVEVKAGYGTNWEILFSGSAAAFIDWIDNGAGKVPDDED